VAKKRVQVGWSLPFPPHDTHSLGNKEKVKEITGKLLSSKPEEFDEVCYLVRVC